MKSNFEIRITMTIPFSEPYTEKEAKKKAEVFLEAFTAEMQTRLDGNSPFDFLGAVVELEEVNELD